MLPSSKWEWRNVDIESCAYIDFVNTIVMARLCIQHVDSEVTCFIRFVHVCDVGVEIKHS